VVANQSVLTFREATAHDRAAILALRERCFGVTDPEKLDPRFWDWEFRDARIFVGERDGAIVTHFALLPYGGFALAVDAMTAPEARGSGAYSGVVGHALEAVRGDFEVAHAYQIRDAVLGPMLRNGWTHEESIPVLVRPASLRALLKLPVAPRARNGAELLRREHAEEMASLARTREWIEWRFFDNPRWTYRVTGVRDAAGRLSAWLVARRTTLKGQDTLAIVDVAFRDRKAARDLIRDAVAEANNLGCPLAAAFVSRAHPARALLHRSLFVPGPHRFRLLVHNLGRPRRREPWRVTWADTDHL
jgi:hypothetical protein